MSNQNEQNRCPHCKATLAKKDLAKISQLSPAQQELLDYVGRLEGPDRVKALKWKHDVVVYHS